MRKRAIFRKNIKRYDMMLKSGIVQDLIEKRIAFFNKVFSMH